MSLSVQYENVHDAQMRLQGTVVLYEEKPVYITNVTEVGAGDPKPDIFRVYAQPLPYVPAARGAADQFRKFISSKKFDLAPFPMGFMNYKGRAYYIHRRPKKQQRQGLSTGTIGIDCIDGRANALNFEAMVSLKEFAECIEGKYPDMERATKDILSGKVRSVAFHRKFALVADADISELIYLYHKQEKAGFIMEDSLKLSKIGSCLKESLREVGIKC